MRFKNIERYRRGGTPSKMELEIPLPTTPDGRIYRYSPNEAAVPRHFLLGGVTDGFQFSNAARARMKHAPRSPNTVCPYSGISAPDQEFTHPDDAKAANKLIEHALMKDVGDEISRMFSDIDQNSSSKFLKIETKSSGYRKAKPRFARRDLLREIVCDHCGRDYGLYALGFFCPDCGAPNLKLHFLREVQLVDQQVDIAESQTNEELAYRLLGNAHEDVLTAFETTLKAVYLFGYTAKGAEAPKPVKNEFQNIASARQRFSELSLDPFGPLSPEEISQLALNIQKRHVIGHNLGVVDAKFSGLADDARIGETVRLVGNDICAFAELTARVVEGLDTWLGGGRPAPAPLPILQNSVTRTAQEDPKLLAARTLSLSPLAVDIGCWLVQQLDEGLNGMIPGEDVMSAFPDVAGADIRKAIGELSLDHYAEITSTLSSHIGRLHPTYAACVEFDALAGFDNPKQTALTLLPLILAEEHGVSVPALHQASGISKRMFNAGLSIILEQVQQGPISRESIWDFLTRSFHVGDEDRVALERLQQELVE